MNKHLQVRYISVHAQCQWGKPELTDTSILQEINIQNMNVELVAQMFKNYQSNVLFHLEGTTCLPRRCDQQ